MNNLNLNNFLDFLSGFSFFGLIIFFFLLLILVLCIYILIYLYIKNRREANYERWKFISDTLIRSAIFFEEEILKPGNTLLKILETDLLPLPGRLKKLLPDPHFRKLLSSELLSAKQNMSGTAALNLKNLFKQLKLDQDALKMLDSRSWYIKASGIQQLGIMGMNDHQDKILKYTNDKRGLIRVEAQNAIVKFSGFDGLWFLDYATYPISEWQQIKLLEELSQLPNENFTGIDKWLKSSNDTVVIFALKLAKNYHRFELYDEVINCLKHVNPEVRRQAIYTAREIYTIETANHLIEVYNNEVERNKIVIVKVLADISTNMQIPFLLEILEEEKNELKIAASYSLASISLNGMEALQSHRKAGEYPLDQIIKQIKSEKK